MRFCLHLLFFHFLLIVEFLNDLFEDCACVAYDGFVRSVTSDFDILLVVGQFSVLMNFLFWWNNQF